MATAGATSQPGSSLQPQQWSITAQHLSRPRSPSSPQVLSRPTLSRRKASSPPIPSNSYDGSELRVGQRSPSPPKQQVILRSASSRQQYTSTGSLVQPRPIHSMFSVSQPQLNLEQLDVRLRSRSHTVSSHDQRNRWSTGPGECPDSSGSIAKSYNLSLTKRSVEDLRPLPVPVVAPKVPPRRGSRLTTVPDRRHSEQINKRCRETRSCEDILESVSTEELKLEKIAIPNKNGVNVTSQAPLQAQQPYPIHSCSQPQISPQPPSNVVYHTDIESQLQPSQGEYHTAIFKDSNHSKEMFQANRDPVAVSTSQRNHVCASDASDSEGNSNYSRNPYSTRDQWTQQKDDQSIGNTVNLSVNAHYDTQQAQMRDLIIEANVSKEHYQRSPSVPTPHSSRTAELINQRSVPADSVYNYGPDTSVTSQHSSSAPPIDEVNDANLSVTPHTPCSSPSPSPQVHREGTETTIPQNYQAFQDNKSATAPHVPHYAIPTNSPSRHMQEQVPQPSNDSVQNTTVVQSTHHSYGRELDHASNTQTPTPSNNNSTSHIYQSQLQDMHSTMHTNEAQQGGSTHYSLTQPADTKPLQSPGVAEVQSHSVSKKAQAFARAFSQWQYNGTTATAKKEQGSTKPNSHSNAKPPVKPKPAGLIKGGTLSLKRDKIKSQKSPESNTKKKSGQKYVFKQSQSRTLLSRGRTASQVDPLTDVGMDTQYNNYTPLNHSQPHSGSSSDSTLRGELKFTESQKGFSASGPSPNSYDYGSQMTPTEDATLTPSSSPELYGPQGYTHGLQQPGSVQSIRGDLEFPRTLQQPQVGEHSKVSAPSPNVYLQTYHKGNQSAANNVTATSSLQPATDTHMKPPSPHPCASNSYSHLPTPANGHTSTVLSSELMPSSQLAPIAEVTLESEQSMSSLLDATEQTDSSQNIVADTNVRTGDTSAKPINISQVASVNSSIGTDESDGKSSPTVQRSTTLPSSYKRPKPYRFNTHKYQSIDIQEQDDKSTEDDSAFSSSSTKLSDFTALNTSIFPKQVKVSSTPLYSSGKAEVSQGEVLDLHFVRQTKAVIMISNSGEEYVVPLNSAIRFAVTYDPLNTGQLVHQGYHFKSIGELIATKEMPSIVVATESYNDPKPQSSVEAGEILVICGVVKQGQGQVLKVTSATHGRKFLEERCTANFSTRPEDTKLSLNDMFKTSVRLPQQAVIYPPAGLQLPEGLVNFPVMLKQFRVIKSVIATPVSPQTYSPTSCIVYDINLELGIEIQEHSEISDHQLIEMRAKTQKLYSSFEPAKVVPFLKDSVGSQEQVTIQSALLTNTDQKGKFLGIQLELPEWLGQMRISKAKLHSQRESLTLQSSQDEAYLKGSSTLLPLNSSVSFQSTDLDQRMLHMERHCNLMDKKLNSLVQSFTSVVHQLTKLKMQSNLQFQMSSEQHRAHNQYVEMMQNTESEEAQKVSLSPPGALNATSKEADNQQARQQLDEEFIRIKEWQKKQEKHMQWQQEQVQHWQIECEKQMQDMQQKLALLEDRQMKFFQEAQQKINQWKDKQPEPTEIQTKTPKDVSLESSAKIKREDSKKPQLPPKPSSKVLSKAVSPAKDKILTKTTPEGDESASSEAVDFGLDMIADNIASWCSQMELELEELYTNSVETNQ